MREAIQDSVVRLLRFQRTPARMTRKFLGLKHNADILPKLQEQLEVVLAAHGKFEPVVYDCQGVNDDGSDIAIRFNPQSKGPEMICFQVKSFDDLTKPNYMQELKAQRHDSFNKIPNLTRYFIFLCTDAVKHKAKVRSIMAEFRSAERTEVIDPGYAYTFLYLPKTRIEAHVTRVMETGDYVLHEALKSLDVSSPSAKALTVFMTAKSTLTGQTRFAQDQLFQEPTLRSIYAELREHQAVLLEESEARRMQSAEEDPDEWDDEPGLHFEIKWEDEDPIQLGEFEDQMAIDLELLEGVVETDSSSNDLILQKDQLLALMAIITDALVRYEYDEKQLIAFMFDLTGIRD